MKSLALVVVLVVGLALAFFPLVAFAVDVTVNGTQVQVSYQEPTTNKTGTPLTDLASTTVRYAMPTTATPTACNTTPASALTGGATITATCLVPIVLDQEADVRFTVTASDTSGNVSDPSIPVDRRLDFLAPAAPQ